MKTHVTGARMRRGTAVWSSLGAAVLCASLAAQPVAAGPYEIQTLSDSVVQERVYSP